MSDRFLGKATYLKTFSSQLSDSGTILKNDLRKLSGFFDLLSPCPQLDLIYTVKFTQPPLLRPLFQDPLPLSDADIISGSSLTRRTHIDEEEAWTRLVYLQENNYQI